MSVDALTGAATLVESTPRPHTKNAKMPLPKFPIPFGVRVALPSFLLGALCASGLLFAKEWMTATVASVNGTPLRSADFYHRLEAAAGPQVLQQMASEEMKLQFARKVGVDAAATQMAAAKLEQAKKDPNWDSTLLANRQTEADVRRSLVVGFVQQAALSKGVSVTDAEVKAFYDRNTDKKNPAARFYQPETVRLAVIVTPTEADARKAILELASGATFAQVAAQYSKDKSAASGGLLSPIGRGRSALTQVPTLEQAVFALAPGQQINAAKVGAAFWTIRCLEKAPETTLAFDKVREDARTGALVEKGGPANQKAMQSALDDFSHSTKVEAVWPRYKAQTVPAP